MRAVVAVPADLVSQSAEGRSQAPATGEVTESEEGESGSRGHEEFPTKATFLNTKSHAPPRRSCFLCFGVGPGSPFICKLPTELAATTGGDYAFRNPGKEEDRAPP